MTLENHHVFFEEPAGKPLDEVMRELRIWLDANKIAPTGFSHEISQSGAIEVHLTFGNRHHAKLFEQAFCDQPALHAADQMQTAAA